MWCRSICSWHPTCLLVGMTGWYDVRIWKNREAVDGSFKQYRLSLLVGGLEHDFYDFPYIGNNDPNWLIFFRGVEATNQIMMRIVTIMTNMVTIKTVVYTLDWLARDIVVIWVMWVRSKNIPCQNKFLMFNQIGDDNPQALICFPGVWGHQPENIFLVWNNVSYFIILYLFIPHTHTYIIILTKSYPYSKAVHIPCQNSSGNLENNERPLMMIHVYIYIYVYIYIHIVYNIYII